MLAPFGAAGAIPDDIVRILEATDESVLALGLRGFADCAEETSPVEFGGTRTEAQGDCVGSRKLAHSLHVARATEAAATERVLPTCINEASINDVIKMDDRKFVAVGRAVLQLDGACEPVRVWKFDEEGMLDSTFARNAMRLGIGANSGRLTLALLGTGRILIGGAFETAGGQPRGRLLVISADGERLRDTSS